MTARGLTNGLLASAGSVSDLTADRQSASWSGEGAAVGFSGSVDSAWKFGSSVPSRVPHDQQTSNPLSTRAWHLAHAQSEAGGFRLGISAV